MKSLTKNIPERVDISKKYHTKIFSKLRMLKESKEIARSKENYNHWINSENNSPVKKPNYKKMNFLLEKLKEKEDCYLPIQQSK